LGSFTKVIAELQQRNVTVLGDESYFKITNVPQIESDLIWYEEFLGIKLLLEQPIQIKKQLTK
jgi:glutamate-5-semialdehyde dehydrogenase